MSSIASLSSSMSSASIASQQHTTNVGINSFHKQTNNLDGFLTSRDTNLKQNLTKKEQAKGFQHDFAHFSTGSKPAVRGRYVAVGTDEPEAKQHFLSILDAEDLIKSVKIDPVTCYTSVVEHVSDVKWLDDTTLLAGTGKGNLKLYKFDKTTKTVKHIGDMNGAAGSYIREIAAQPGVANVVIGGFDHKLNFLDLNKPDHPYTQRLDMQSVIGSIKWSPFNANSYVSCTLDEGKFYLFDSRTRISQAAFYSDLKQDDLFCHERYNDFNVLFGFGNGQFMHLDMRQGDRILHTEQDPYVDAIGGIEYNQESKAIVVSGYTDFSVYQIQSGEAKIWSHSHNTNDRRHAKGWACGAAWYDATTVVAAGNTGAVGLYLQDFA